MRPSNRFSYAVKALVDLTVHQGSGPVTVAAIAKRQSIPVRSLEQLFNQLRRKGLVEAARGPRGGYRLKKPAKQIPIQLIFEIVEPKGLSLKKAGSAADPARAVWQQVEKAVARSLEATTLEALAAQAREQAAAPISHRYTFHI